MTQNPKLNAQTPKILWFAFTFSKFIFLYVALKIIAPQDKPIIFPPKIPIEKDQAIILYVLGGASLVIFIIAQKLPKYLFKLKMKKLNQSNGQAHSSSMGMDESHQINLEDVYIPFLLRMACFDAVCVSGVVTVVLMSDGSWMLPFFGAALLGNLLNFPGISLYKSFYD